MEQSRRHYGFCVYGYVVMPEHVHLLVSEPPRAKLATAIQALKQAVSRRLIGGRAHFGQCRYYDFNVWSEAKRIEKLRYMRRNPGSPARPILACWGGSRGPRHARFWRAGVEAGEARAGGEAGRLDVEQFSPLRQRNRAHRRDRIVMDREEERTRCQCAAAQIINCPTLRKIGVGRATRQEVHIYSLLDGGEVYDSSVETGAVYKWLDPSVGQLKTLRSVDRRYSWDWHPAGDWQIINQRVTCEATTLDDGTVSKTETDYETFTDSYGVTGSYTVMRNNVKERREFDFGTNCDSTSAAALRKTHYNYWYEGHSGYIDSSHNVADRVSSVKVLDGQGNLTASTSTSYDNTVVLAAASAAGHDYQNYPTTMTVRGNPTQVSRWRDTDGAWLTTTNWYDELGNLRQTQDPLQHNMLLDYTDSWGNTACAPTQGNAQVYVTKTTNHLGQTTKATYNSCPGTVASTTDTNNQVTTFTYDDFDRLHSTTYPDAGTVTDAPNDALPYQVTRTRTADPDPAIVSTTQYDAVGRVAHTILNDSQVNDQVDINYDSLGRVYSVSNPHRPTASATDGISYYNYDSLNRLLTVTKQDGTTVSTSYSGATTTIGDEAGNPRKTYSDALGRLIQVDEPSPTVVHPARPSSGYIDIGGSERCTTCCATAGTQATAAVQISGTEDYVFVCVPPPDGIGRCDPDLSYTQWDYGTVSVTINGFTKQANYGQFSTPSTIVSDLAQWFNGDGSSPVTASPSGSTLYLTMKAAGGAINGYTPSPIAQTGDPTDFPSSSFAATASGFSGESDGTPPQTVYDTGMVVVAVNGEQHSVNYGQYSTPTSIATDIANQFGGSTYVYASASGSQVTFTSKQAGSSTASYALSAPPPSTTNSTYFSGASFTTSPSGGTLTGGGDQYTTGGMAAPYTTVYTYNLLNDVTCVEQRGGVTGTGCSSDPSLDASSPWRVRRFGYNSLSQLTSAKNPESGTINYTYYDDGPVYTKTDARGILTTYSYDGVHRVVGQTYTDGSPNDHFEYDQSSLWGISLQYPIGRLTHHQNDVGGSSLMSYDKMGRVVEQWDCMPSNCGTGSYHTQATYNLAGAISSLTYPSGRVVNNTYVSPGWLAKVYSNLGTEYDFVNVSSFWPTGGWETANYGNGTQQSDTYNKRLQPNELQLYAPDHATLRASLQYVWTGCNAISANNNGNVCRINDLVSSSRNKMYSYDQLNRILSGVRADTAFSISFSYDPWGNVNQSGTSISGGYLNNNRLIAFNYDAAGNQLNDPAHSYTYNASNLITTVDSTGATYRYFANGDRVRKDVGANWTEHVHFGGQVIAEHSGSTWTDYIFAGSKRIAQSTSPSAGSTQYYWADHLSSSMMQTDNNGAIIWQTDYAPFGQEPGGNSGGPHYKFTGKERDTETGLDYLGARYYGSNMGRFMSPDPSHDGVRLDNPQTWNRYSYVLNNPLELIDPTGEEWNLKGNNSAEWVDQCGVADDCIRTIALSDNKSVSVYGTDGASDVTRYDANDKGMVNVTDVAKNDDSQFQVAQQQHPENYLSPEATAALYNTAEAYHESYPRDSKLAMTGGSTSSGEPATDAAGNPVHRGHHGGNNIDLRYMGADGRQLTGSTALAQGDANRNKTVINGMKADGFKGAITGDSGKYGSKRVSPSLANIHKNHIHIQKN